MLQEIRWGDRSQNFELYSFDCLTHLLDHFYGDDRRPVVDRLQRVATSTGTSATLTAQLTELRRRHRDGLTTSSAR